jgi:hypothetical protein
MSKQSSSKKPNQNPPNNLPAKTPNQTPNQTSDQPLSSPSTNILGTKTVNQVITFVCCLLIALGFNELLFKNNISGAIPNFVIGTLLMPGVMNWEFQTANKYQKIIMVVIAVFNFVLIGYLLNKSVFKFG